MSITGSLQIISNSVELASLKLQTFLENSITATCNHKQIHKKGILFSLANLTQFIFHSTHLPQNHHGIIIQSNCHVLCKFIRYSLKSLFSKVSDSIQFSFTFALLFAQA
jgi:hypothetical protein